MRDEFEEEWDLSCEQDIAQLEFGGEESAEEIEMKLSLLQLYNERLEKRYIFTFSFSFHFFFELVVRSCV